MKMNKTVYCEFSFLKDFLKSRPKHNDAPLEYDPVQSWIKLYLFLCKSSTHIDISQAKFAQEATTEESLLKFFKQSSPNLHFCNQGFDNCFIDSSCSTLEKLNSVYFSSRNKIERTELSKALGIIVIGKQETTQFESLFCERTIAIPKGNHYKSWNDISFPEYTKVSNSMIIVDNFILKPENMESMIELLDNILPEKLECSFDLTIYTIPNSYQEKTMCETIIQKIKGLRNEKMLNAKIVICKVNTSEFHDRTIITNNLWMDCGSGFDLFSNRKASKRTNLRFAFPFMMNAVNHKSWENEAYIFLIKDILKIEKPGRSHTYNTDYWGDESRENRLLSFYQRLFSMDDCN